MEIYSALYVPANIFEPMETVELTHDNQAIYNQLDIHTFKLLPTGDPFLEGVGDENAISCDNSELNIRATMILDEIRTRNGHPQPPHSERGIYGNVLFYGGYDYNTERKLSLTPHQEEQLRNIVEQTLGDYDYDQ